MYLYLQTYFRRQLRFFTPFDKDFTNLLFYYHTTEFFHVGGKHSNHRACTSSSTSLYASWRFSVNGYANRPFDRVLGAAATLGLGVFLFQTFCRYLRRMKDDESNSWIVELTKLLRNSVKEGRASSEDDSWHAGACHCRSVLFEVSCCTILSFDFGFRARWLLRF